MSTPESHLNFSGATPLTEPRKPRQPRTDRNNNPIAAAVGSGGKNQFTKALDDAGIQWEHGDPFPSNEGGDSTRTIKIKGDSFEGARAILSNTNAVEGWYSKSTGKSVLPKYGVRSGRDFAALPRGQQDEIIHGIYQSEGGTGTLKPSVNFSGAVELGDEGAPDITKSLSELTASVDQRTKLLERQATRMARIKPQRTGMGDVQQASRTRFPSIGELRRSEDEQGQPSRVSQTSDELRVMKGEQPVDRQAYARRQDAQTRLSRMQDESYRERQAREAKDTEWRRVNQPEIDRQTKLYREDIQKAKQRGSDANKWLAELGTKAAGQLAELGPGDTLKIHSEAALRAAEEEGADRSQLSRGLQNIGAGFIGSAPELGAMALGVPPVAAFAAGSAVRSKSSDPLEVAKAAEHGAATGLAFETPGIGEGVKRVATKALGVGGTSAGLELAQGATPGEAATAGITNALLVGAPEAVRLRGERNARQAETQHQGVQAEQPTQLSSIREDRIPVAEQSGASAQPVDRLVGETGEVNPQRFQHLQFGEVEVLPDQTGARNGKLKVAEVANPEKIHYVRKADKQGRGNAQLLPIKELAVESRTAELTPPQSPATASAEQTPLAEVAPPAASRPRTLQTEAPNVRESPQVDISSVEPSVGEGEKPFTRERQYYEEWLADPELARYAISVESPEGNLFAVPVGGSRKTGASSVLYSKPEGERLLQKIAGLPGFENARLRPVKDSNRFSLEWGGPEVGYRSETNPTEKIGRAYGYSEQAIADFIAEKHDETSMIAKKQPDLGGFKVDEEVEYDLKPSGHTIRGRVIGHEIDRSTQGLVLVISSEQGLARVSPWNVRKVKSVESAAAVEKQEDLLAELESRIQKFDDEATDLKVPYGSIGAGAADFDPRVRADALMTLKRELQRGKSPQEAAASAKQDARNIIAKHNRQRPNDENWQRHESTADAEIENAISSIEQFAPEAKSSVTPASPKATEIAKTMEPDVKTKVDEFLQKHKTSHADLIAERLGLTHSEVVSALYELEMAGRVKAQPHGVWEAKKGLDEAAPEWVKTELRQDNPTAPEPLIAKAAARGLGGSGVPDVTMGDRYRKNGFWYMKGVEGFMGGVDTRVTDPRTQANWDIEYEMEQHSTSHVREVDKEPWQMTANEYQEQVMEPNNTAHDEGLMAADDVQSFIKSWQRPKDHDFIVRQALEEGKPVPPEVLADYPDLVKGAQNVVTPTPSKTTTKAADISGEGSLTAVPPTPKGREASSVKNAATEELRADLDLAEIERPEKRAWQTSIDNAQARGLDKQADAIADKVIKGNREVALDLEESAALLIKTRELENQWEDVYRKNPTDPKLTEIKAQLDKMSAASDLGGTETARTLSFRRAGVDKSFRLISLIRQAEKAKGRSVTPEESARYADIVKERDTAIAQRDKALGQLYTKRLQDDLDRSARQRKRSETKEALDKEAVVIGQNIAAEFARLKSQAAKGQFTSLGGLGSLDPEGVITKNLLKYAQNRARANIGLKAEALIDDAHKLVSEFGVSRRQVAEVLSGYGRMPVDKRSEAAKKLAEIRTEITSLLKTEDVQVGKRSERQEGPKRDLIRNQNRLKQLQSQEIEWERKFNQRDFSERQKPEPYPYNSDVRKAEDRVRIAEAKFNREMQRAQPGHQLRNLSGVMKAWLLSGPPTQAMNIAGTGGYQVFREIARLPAAIADGVWAQTGARAFGNQGQRSITAPSPSAMLDSVVQAGKVGGREALEILRHGATKEDMERHQYQEIDFGINTGNKKIDTGVKIVELAHNVVFRFMSASDRVFYQGAYKRNLIDRATVQAKNEDVSDVKARAKELIENPSEQLEADAKHDALVSTFNNSNWLSSKIKRARSAVIDKESLMSKKSAQRLNALENFAMDFVLPFDRTPTNVVSRIVEASPAGYLKNAGQLVSAMMRKTMPQEHQRQMMQTFGNATTGTALMGLGWYLADKAKGIITIEDYDVFLNIPGLPKINLRTASPVGNIIAMGAKLRAAHDDERSTWGDYVKPVLSEPGNIPILRAGSPIAETLRDPERSGPKTAARFASMAVPFGGAVRWIGKGIDPAEKRYPDKSFTQQFQQGIPKWREGLPTSKNKLLPNAAPDDPLVKELKALDKQVDGVDKQDGEAHDQYIKRRDFVNKQIEDDLRALVDTRAYKQLSAEDKKEQITMHLTKVTKRANEEYQLQNGLRKPQDLRQVYIEPPAPVRQVATP